MRTVLIEDEPIALARLKELCKEAMPEIEILAGLDSVAEAVEWLDKNGEPDLLITDIELADGTCFDLFSRYSPKCPVIFTTAYNQYAIDAFRLHTIDYLLKPVKKEDLRRALEKYQNLQQAKKQLDYAELAKHVLALEGKYDKRYMVRYGDQLRSINASDIAYVYTSSKAIFATLFSGKTYPLDKTLDQLEKELNPAQFFRINRQFIVHYQSIIKMQIVSKSRVQLDLNPPFTSDEVIVSTEKSPLFKEWLGGQE